MKKTLAILLILNIFSCKEKDTCYPEFKESLSYLRDFSEPRDNKSRLTDEIFRNLEIVETTSGILNHDRGDNPIRFIIVTQKDIDKWEKWISEQCPKNNKIE